MMSLLSRLVRPRRQTNAVAVTFYTRQNCCCCHNALDVLKRYERKHRLVIEEVDIDADPELVALYGESVPVVAVAGKIRFKGVVNPALLERLLLAMRRGA
jgi:glutaredoxin